jgi:hypothetical protein
MCCGRLQALYDTLGIDEPFQNCDKIDNNDVLLSQEVSCEPSVQVGFESFAGSQS